MSWHACLFQLSPLCPFLPGQNRLAVLFSHTGPPGHSGLSPSMALLPLPKAACPSWPSGKCSCTTHCLTPMSPSFDEVPSCSSSWTPVPPTRCHHHRVMGTWTVHPLLHLTLGSSELMEMRCKRQTEIKRRQTKQTTSLLQVTPDWQKQQFFCVLPPRQNVCSWSHIIADFPSRGRELPSGFTMPRRPE